MDREQVYEFVKALMLGKVDAMMDDLAEAAADEYDYAVTAVESEVRRRRGTQGLADDAQNLADSIAALHLGWPPSGDEEAWRAAHHTAVYLTELIRRQERVNDPAGGPS